MQIKAYIQSYIQYHERGLLLQQHLTEVLCLNLRLHTYMYVFMYVYAIVRNNNFT